MRVRPIGGRRGAAWAPFYWEKPPRPEGLQRCDEVDLGGRRKVDGQVVLLSQGHHHELP